MEIKTWQDFGALSEEQLAEVEDVETLKTSIEEAEGKTFEAHLSETLKKTNADLDKSKKDYESQKVRAEKAEKEAKLKKGEKVEVSPYSITDVKALVDVPEEDIDELQSYAKFKNISIAEAKKTSTMQTYLRERAEERRTAQITDTKGGRPSIKVSGDVILDRARQGQLPEKDEDIDKLADARMEAKKARK